MLLGGPGPEFIAGAGADVNPRCNGSWRGVPNNVRYPRRYRRLTRCAIVSSPAEVTSRRAGESGECETTKLKLDRSIGYARSSPIWDCYQHDRVACRNWIASVVLVVPRASSFNETRLLRPASSGQPIRLGAFGTTRLVALAVKSRDFRHLVIKHRHDVLCMCVSDITRYTHGRKKAIGARGQSDGW